MNAGQEALENFVMERVQEEKKAEAKAILDECFAKQGDGTFNAAYLAGITPKLAASLKPEFIEEAKAMLAKFGAGDVVSKLAGGLVGSLFGGGGKADKTENAE